MTAPAHAKRQGPWRRRALRALALSAALAAPGAAAAPARQSEPPATRVDQDARRKVEAALDALGGAARLRSLVSVVIRAEGREHRSAEAQGYDPERVTDAPHEETVVAYLSEEKFLYEHKTGRHDGTTRHRRWSYVGGERAVELINVGPNPHTSENVVVHLPRERIIFQGDLFYFDGEATFPPRNRRTIMPFFARWLVGRGLAPERIYGYHDRGFATMEHVRRVLAGEGSTSEVLTTRRRGRARRPRT